MELTNEKIKTMQTIFSEERTINPIPLEQVPQGNGDVYQTEDGEIIYLELQLNSFTIDELVRYTDIMESLYDKYNKHCTAYIICVRGVEIEVQEMPIKSEADFTIKLAQTDINPCDVILNGVKTKIKNGILLDKNDIRALQMIPLMCDENEKNYYRKQVFEIMNRLGL